MKSINVCSRSMSFHDDLILQVPASGERSQDNGPLVAQNIDCGYTQSMFWSKNKKNRCTPANLSFAI